MKLLKFPIYKVSLFFYDKNKNNLKKVLTFNRNLLKY